ncbi:hypothetical protein NPA31_011910 [Aurantimonas sp. MSK8Z-1]|uniref:hypothetical protein n=1 Tax=Mangrovibrevibacter kandeliae TaxID=2968473 RepID=UPI0021195F1C|nr:hypothetical protein [Aurantimonas sp. MSK8Z-1]MCW4115669.1 hypothetical protein [Aurantimonas sp. MSK8Z-1]
MARGATLIELLTDLRAESRTSLNPAHNTAAREVQINLLQRTQRRLWQDFTWPHLRTEWQVPAQAGQRYYDTPENLDIERVEKIDVFSDGAWCPLSPGINDGHLAAWNSDLDERAWPPRCWRIARGAQDEGEQIEIWPIADQNADPLTRTGYLRLTGTRTLRPLLADSDRCDLDAQLLVLYAAAELLASTGAKDAPLKLDAANRLYTRLRASLTPARRFQMFGVADARPPRRMIARYRPPV